MLPLRLLPVLLLLHPHLVRLLLKPEPHLLIHLICSLLLLHHPLFRLESLLLHELHSLLHLLVHLLLRHLCGLRISLHLLHHFHHDSIHFFLRLLHRLQHCDFSLNSV